jgi:light-regulated signal transduction histidine kinase (bacteriophytochrome)
LNLAKRIAEGYEGDITVESEVGVGSAFRVRLPESHACDRAPQPVEPDLMLSHRRGR